MKADYQRKLSKQKPDAPMFESTWLALFSLLRYEWLQYRNHS